jgi:tetratricopeptide (TPR) repeat protein
MSQRPNPHNIGICALIAIYSDPNSLLHDLEHDDVDVDGSSIVLSENVVATFLEESVSGNNQRINNDINNNNNSNDNVDVNNDITVFKNMNDDTNYDNSLALWMMKVKRHLGIQATELLVDTLHMASESVDSLMDLFESLKGAILEGLVDATSLHGLYLRQYCLGFDELSFESVILLWQALKERVSSIQISSTLDENNNNNNNNDGNGNGNGNGSGDNKSTVWAWPLSTDQLQSILRQDCIGFEVDHGQNNDGNINNNDDDDDGDEQMNKNITHHPASRHRARISFEEMEVYIRNMLKNNPELPAAHFLRYLNCLRHGERVGALDALHEYFDHSMVHHTNSRSVTSVDNNNNNTNGTASASSSASKDILQFSAILLAMTHSSFGDSNLALLATEEAVRVAQQSKDAACVAFALGWLYEHHGHGTAERRELLRRCASRASQGQLRPLVAGAQLTLAKHALQGDDPSRSNSSSTYGERSSAYSTGEEGEMSSQGGGNWTTSWNHLLQVTAEPSTDHSGTLDRPTYLSQDPKEVLESMALQRLVSAGIWDSLGMPAMSEWASKTTLNQQEELSYGDILATIQNISRCALYGSPPPIKSLTAGRQGKYQTESAASNRPCSYAKAVSAMLQLRTELGLDGNDLEEPILHNLALIFHEWAVNRGDMDDAIALQMMLDSYLHPGLYNRDQLNADIRMQKYLYFCRAQNWEKAKETGTSLVGYCKSKGLLNNQARILIQMGIAELESGRKQCTTALSPLLEALAMCEKWEMHGLHAAAMSILAQVFYRLQNPKRAIATIEATLPTLLQRGHIWFQAQAYLTLCKSHLKYHNANSTATKTKTNTTRTAKKRFHHALHALNKSMKLFEECQDRYRLREVYYLQAHIHSLLSNNDKRDAMSDRFLKVGNIKRCNVTTILDSLGDPLKIQLLVDRSIY